MLARFLPDSVYARPRAVFALMVIVALIAALPSTVAAQEARGALFTGMGFIDDHSVEDGVVVEAWVSGTPVAATEIFNQGFILYVAEPPGESFDGEVVRFKFRGLKTNASAGWVEGTESWILLYAYTGLQGVTDGFNGNVTADPEPDDISAIRELQARLSVLELERSEIAAELDHQFEIDIANVTNRWEGAIAELRAEVEREIQQLTKDFEFEARQLLLGSRRDGSPRSLKAELNAIIEENWARFELESQQKQRYLRKEIIEVELARDFELNNLNQLIHQVESDLELRLGEVGLSFDDLPIPDHLHITVNDFRLPEDPKIPVIPVAPHPDEPPNEGKDLFNPETPTPEIPTTPDIPLPEESGRNRGFFFNSISADPNGLNKLDPTALAVIGILITLAATGVQLLKGN